MSAHARLSASAAHRWLHCPASLGESKPSIHAATGTFAHEIAATCAFEGRDPQTFLGHKGNVDGFDIECDQEMVDAIKLYVDAVRGDMQPGDEVWAEMPLQTALQKVDEDMGGTADFVRYRPSTNHLRVWDFKYGAGVYVEVDDNSQLKIYGLGAMVEVNKPILDVTLSIVQPRFEGAAPVRDFDFKAVDILDFVADIREAAVRTREPNPQPVAGEQCKAFCPNARTCPELEKRQHALVAADFNDITTFDPAKLASALAAIPLVKERIKAIEEFAYAHATAGGVVPGYKLVDKRATRKWKSEGDVIEWAQKNALDPFEKPDVLSPAQMEKRMVAAGTPKKKATEAVDQFTEKVSSGTALVPESDERPAAKLISVDDFAVIEG